MGVSSKVMVFVLGPSLETFATGIFEIAVRSWATFRVTSKVAFLSGSSQHGNALLASVDSN